MALRLHGFYRYETVEAKGRAMARVLASPCTLALERRERKEPSPELERLVADLRTERDPAAEREPELVSLAVLDARGELLPGATIAVDSLTLAGDRLVARARVEPDPTVLVDYPSGKWGPNGEALVTFALPLRTEGVSRGVLWFELSLERARSLFVGTLVSILGPITAGAIVTWFFLYKTVKRRVVAPILELSKAIERVRGGDLDARVSYRRPDEIGTVIASFNDLVAMLREKPALEHKLDEAEKLEVSHRRLADAHRELADAHAQLQATQERLVLTEKQASLGRLVRAFAHELKNPLNSATNALPSLEASLGRLQTVYAAQREAASREVSEDLEDVASAVAVLRRSVSRAVSIIHDLQGFAQLGEADLVPVELRRVVDDAALACAQHLSPRGPVHLELDVPDVPLKAFPTLLAQTFVNLFTNAAQAIQGPGTITLTARAKGDRVKIEVKDTGPGIAPENLPRLFEPFFTTKGVTGTGLGLALCYAYVEKHGGTIEARSEVGKGATFTIDLPLNARPGGEMSPRTSALFDVPRDSIAAAARARRGG